MGIAEAVIGRAFARPVGSTHPTIDVTSRSRGAVRPRFASRCPPLNRGSREDRVLAAPAVSRAKCAKKRTRAYRYRRNTPAFPAQWLYGLCRALPGDEFVLSPSLAN